MDFTTSIEKLIKALGKLDILLKDKRKVVSKFQNPYDETNIAFSDTLHTVNSVIKRLEFADNALFPKFLNNTINQTLEEINYMTSMLESNKIDIEKLEIFNDNLVEAIYNIPTKIDIMPTKVSDFINKHEVELDNYKTEVRKEIGEIQRDFLKSFNENSQRFNDQSLSFENTFNNKVNQTKTKFEKTYDEFNTRTTKAITEIEKYRDKAKEVLGHISTNAIAANYEKVANKHEKSASRWQIFTMIAFGVTILIALIAFFTNNFASENWQQFTGKIIVTAALGSLTAYTARQAKYHIDSEKKNRKLEVELRTLEPFIADLEDRALLKQQLFPLIFGKEELVKTGKGKYLSASELTENVIKGLSEHLKKP